MPIRTAKYITYFVPLLRDTFLPLYLTIVLEHLAVGRVNVESVTLSCVARKNDNLLHHGIRNFVNRRGREPHHVRRAIMWCCM